MTIYGESVIKGRIFVVLHKQLYGFHVIIRVLLCMNHPTKLTVVWGNPDFAVAFPRMNHHTRFTLVWGSLRLAQLCTCNHLADEIVGYMYF